jgi:hypothetical protein
MPAAGEKKSLTLELTVKKESRILTIEQVTSQVYHFLCR